MWSEVRGGSGREGPFSDRCLECRKPWRMERRVAPGVKPFSGYGCLRVKPDSGADQACIFFIFRRISAWDYASLSSRKLNYNR